MNTSQLALDELFALIKHAAREIMFTTPENTRKNREFIEGHASRINNLLEALEERDGQEAQALVEDINRKMESKE